MALVDYGSDSDSDNDEMNGEAQQPPASASSSKALNAADDTLEDIVKPKDWERQLAEKAKKKLEKKAKKAAKKEKKHAKKEGKIKKVTTGIAKPSGKGKVVIAAFGALGSLVNDAASDSEDEPEAAKKTPSFGTSSSTGFLSFLPAPKGKNNTIGTISNVSLKPSSVAKKPQMNRIPVAKPTAVVAQYDDSDDDEPTDFFGFSSAAKADDFEEEPEIPALAANGSMDLMGPTMPDEDEEGVDPTQMYDNFDAPEPTGKVRGAITDAMAHRLIMQHAHDIGPGEGRSYNEMANGIVNVRVDDALGADVKANVLKNLTHRAFAKATSAPLPQPPGITNQLARRKHQITYLANLAVSREEALQEKWSEQKQTKRMGRAKYGF